MIEINLSPTNKDEQNELLALLSKIDVKMMVIALAILFVPEYLFLSYNDSEIESYNAQSANYDNELRALNVKMDELRKIEEQIDALKLLEKSLGEKLEVVKQIISKRQNPFHLLQYIANNTPADIWITDFKMEEGNIEIKGFSETWKSIGVFLENLKSSIFFEKNIRYEQPKLTEDKYEEWSRKEYFVITSRLVRFE